MKLKQKITPFLWFDGQAEEAANFYISIFKDSKIVATMRHQGPTSDQGPAIMSVTFQLAGQEFIALNGGPQFKFNEAISLFVSCETQQEVDELWEKLSAGGEEIHCGWRKDKFGLCWQIVPMVLGQILHGKDPVKAGRAMQAMLQMKKLDIQQLQDAYDGRSAAG
jgi:predicted 3-demethylubiquinone-9 3-methyltransferase (glyoxalase superfamily)